MSLKQLVEDLLTEVNEAHTKVDNSETKKRDRASAYSLFSSWPDDRDFKPVCQFCFESGHTANDLFGKYADVFGIIRNMLNIANGNFDWATGAGHITGEDKTVAKKKLDDIQKHLDYANHVYLMMTYTEFRREFAASVSHLALPHALAQLKALSAPCQGCDCNCACAACTTGAAAAVIRKKPQPGCRCMACCERSTTHTGP